MAEMKRISGYIDTDLYDAIEEIAKKDNRKFAPMVTILLQQAVKERNRKKKKVI
jgi:hypothetical protein